MDRSAGFVSVLQKGCSGDIPRHEDIFFNRLSENTVSNTGTVPEYLKSLPLINSTKPGGTTVHSILAESSSLPNHPFLCLDSFPLPKGVMNKLQHFVS